MTKRVFRPFWRYGVMAAEKWLAGMAAAGWLLQAVRCCGRVFVFGKRQPEKLIYRIDYSRKEEAITPTLESEGWREIAAAGGWRILANQNTKPALFPPREGVISKTRGLLNVSFYLLLLAGSYLSLVSMGILVDLVLNNFSDNYRVERVPAPYPILDLAPYAAAAAGILLLIWIIYSFVQARKGLAGLSAASGYSLYPSLIRADNPLIRARLGANNLLKVTRWFWFADPGRLTAWLESQAAGGMLLKRIHKNSFSFKEGPPRKIKYYVDAHKDVAPGYFDIHSQAGFTLIGDLPQQFGRAFIWSREQAEPDAVPELYTDKAERLARAGRHLSINLKGALYRLALSVFWLLIGWFSVLPAVKGSLFFHLFWVLLIVFWLIMLAAQLYILYLSAATYQREKLKVETDAGTGCLQ